MQGRPARRAHERSLKSSLLASVAPLAPRARSIIQCCGPCIAPINSPILDAVPWLLATLDRGPCCMICIVISRSARVGLTRARSLALRSFGVHMHFCYIFGGVRDPRALLVKVKDTGIVSALPGLILFCLTIQFLIYISSISSILFYSRILLDTNFHTLYVVLSWCSVGRCCE